MSIWEKDELRREETRGIFVLGILASILAYRTLRGTTPPKNLLESAFDLISTLILYFWGIYVGGMVISMTSWVASGGWKWVLTHFKSWANLAFYLGSMMSIIAVVFLGPFILVDSVQGLILYYADHPFDLLVTASSLVIFFISLGVYWLTKYIKPKGRA